MNKLIDFFSRQHSFVNLMTLLVIGIGVYSTLNIRREAFPAITFDIITVTTPYPNASAESVESLITDPLESDLLEVFGVKEMSSVSIEGRSVITLQLDPDEVTTEEAEADIQDIVEKFRDLPEGAEEPIVITPNSKTQPLITIGLGGDLTSEELRGVAKRLKRFLERLDGVASVGYRGLPKYELKIDAKPDQLLRYQLSLTDLVNALSAANINIPAGNYLIEEAGKSQEFALKTLSEIDNAEAIGNVVLRSNIAERFIRVKDVANVKLRFAKEEILYRTNMRRGINLVVSKQSKADAIRMVSGLKTEVETFKNSLPKGVEFTYLDDRSQRVARRVSILSTNMVLGLTLVLIVLSVMLPIRVALVAAIGIPFSFLATMLIFDYGDISLNLISMMGLIIVVGMLVDDAIVVTENAQRKLEEGLSPGDAARAGTKEIWRPVLTSVTTTLAAFVPLMMMTGIFGKFVVHLPIGVVIALIISLFECFFILPSHIAEWVRPKGMVRRFSVRYFWEHHVAPAYAFVLRRLVRFKYLVVLTAIFGALFSGWFAKNKMPFVFFPGSTGTNFTTHFELAAGTPLEESEGVAKSIEQIITEVVGQDLDSLITTVGSQSRSRPGGQRETRGAQYALITAHVVEDRDLKMSINEMIDIVKAKAYGIAPFKSITFAKGRHGPPVGKAVSINVIGEDYPEVQQGVAKLKEMVTSIPGSTDVEDTFAGGKEQIIVQPDPDALSLAGLSGRDVAIAVRAKFDGIVVDQVQKLDEKIDIRVTVIAPTTGSLEKIEDTLIPNKRGQLIKLSRIAKLERVGTAGSYQHLNALRVIQVQAEIDEKVTNSQKVNQEIRSKMPGLIQEFPNLSFEFGGEEKDRIESFASLGKTFLFAIAGILVLLMLQFNNFYQPLIVALMVPLGLLSVIWAFYLHDMPLSFLGIIGMIALAGVIVNNAIIFIDFFNRKKREGLSTSDAIVSAGGIRLRPIFLTTVTTVVGILPTAYGLGGMDRFVVPVAMSLGFGMLFGSMLTLLVLPALIAVVDDVFKFLLKPFQKQVRDDEANRLAS